MYNYNLQIILMIRMEHVSAGINFTEMCYADKRLIAASALGKFIY